MRRTLLNVITILGVLALASGCADTSFQSALEKVNQGKLVEPPDAGGGDTGGGDTGGGDKPDPVPACEVPATHYQLKAQVVSLEITSKNRGSFGFDVLKGWFKFFKTKFSAIKGRLDLAVDIVDSVSPETIIANGQGISKMSKREFSFEFGIKDYGINYEHFSKTPLAKLTKLGLRNALADMHKKFVNTSEEWSSIVRYVEHKDSGSKVIIAAGTSSNLKIGDRLSFYNIEHRWVGEPCESEHLFAQRTTKRPLATGVVIQLDNHAAAIELDSRNEGSREITLGAEAVVEQLTDTNRNLYRPLEIVSVEGGEWKVENEDPVDFTPYLITQINAEAAKFDFVIQRVKQGEN